MVYNTTFLLRRGTKESWERNNPILAYGEPGYDSTNYGLKIGDGKTHWNDLHFMSTTEEEIEKAIKDYFEKNPGSGGNGQPGKDGISATHEWNGSVLTITSASGSSSSNLLGPKGNPGRGIASILRTSGNGEPGSIDIYTITYSDGTTDSFSVYNGKDGFGVGNEAGENGATFIPSISDGILSWTNDKNLENPEPVNIIGPQGESGYAPQKGIDYWTNEDKQEIISELPAPDLTGYATEEFVNKQIADAQLSGNGEINLSAYYTKSETNAAIKTAVEAIELMPGPQGEPGPKGDTPQKYVDYFTEEDVSKIVDKVVENIPDIEGGAAEGFIAQDEPPENTKVLWIDTNDNSSQGGVGGTGNVDLTGYATENWVQDNYQPKGEYLTEHQDISGKLDSDKLPEAIDIALALAKESGDFNGQPGTDGKSAYEYAQDGGFTGTEEAFANKLAAEYLPISGGDLTGDLRMNGHKLSGLNAPVEEDEAATKGYAVAKDSVVNNFTTTEPGFVADARALKVLNDNIGKISHIREFSPGQTVDITFGTYRTAALVFSAGSVSKAICYLFSNGYLSPLSTVENVSASLSDDYKTITITNNSGSGLYAILGVLHLGTTSMTVKTRS